MYGKAHSSLLELYILCDMSCAPFPSQQATSTGVRIACAAFRELLGLKTDIILMGGGFGVLVGVTFG